MSNSDFIIFISCDRKVQMFNMFNFVILFSLISCFIWFFSSDFDLCRVMSYVTEAPYWNLYFIEHWSIRTCILSGVEFAATGNLRFSLLITSVFIKLTQVVLAVLVCTYSSVHPFIRLVIFAYFKSQYKFILIYWYWQLRWPWPSWYLTDNV